MLILESFIEFLIDSSRYFNMNQSKTATRREIKKCRTRRHITQYRTQIKKL